MTPLIDALRRLGLHGEVALGGRWLTLRGERCSVYVTYVPGDGYYTWCDDPDARAVEAYPDPEAAIAAGLRRARRRETEAVRPE